MVLVFVGVVVFRSSGIVIVVLVVIAVELAAVV